MAVAEDAATILDEFVHEVANLPAEIQHLLEEIEAKDVQVQAFRMQITQKDQSLQKHVKQNGGHVKHPREDQITKLVLAQYDKAQALQEEKVALAERARILLDRHVKRLDIKIERLPDSSLLEDRLLPSLLRASSANLVEPVSASRSGIATPVTSFGTGPGGPSIANAAMARMANINAHASRGVPQAPMAGIQPHSLLGSSAVQRVREGSAGSATAGDPKRRKLQLSTLPLPSSNLARGASAGPGTPKAGTPVSRGGSLGPRTKKTMKRMPDHPLRKKMNKPAGGLSKKAARRLKNLNRNSPSTTGGDSSDGSGSEEDVSQSQVAEGAEEEDVGDDAYEEEGDEGEDNNLYCICQKPSHGDMIACDNAKCHFEWFHYECVGLKEEPKGKWLCPECRKLPPNQLKIAK